MGSLHKFQIARWRRQKSTDSRARQQTIKLSANRIQKLGASEDDSDAGSFAGFNDEASHPDEDMNAATKDDLASAGESRPDSNGSGNAKNSATQKTFANLGMIDSLCEVCTSLGSKTPTAIQIEAIPIALDSKDIIGLAKTGSGKTAAFALPILQALLDKPQAMLRLVMAPTRELAYQISQQFEALSSLISVRCAVIIGNMDMVSQAIALAKKPHIIVATPSRLIDHLENTKGFSLRQLKYLVMDEADRLLDLDFGLILDKILQVLPCE